MTKEEYNSMKDGYYEMVTKMLTDFGGLGPSITILGIHKEDGKNAIVHIAIEGKYMKDEDSKDEFVDVIIPQVAERVRQEFDIKAVVWASEAWLRVFDKSATAEQIRNWKSFPVKKEVLIFVIDSEQQSETIIKEIVRKGKQVNEDGELTDHIELVDMPDYEQGVTGEGRFSNLYKKFTENP
jgi:hypothetical protein